MSSAVLSKSSVYDTITEKIVAAIRAGAGTYTMPWHGGSPAICIPTNAATEAPYRGVNIVALWAEAATKGYASGQWASYRQWQKLGAQVRAGERGSIVVFYKKIEAGEGDDEDQPTERLRFVARASWVFNEVQVDGWKAPPLARVPEFLAIKEIEAFVQATRADVRHGAPMARYRHDQDCIEMPDRDCFIGSATSTSTETYYSVLLHELTHWSGAAHRLERRFGKRFGDPAYALEELVAELGAAFLCAALGIANEPRQDHAAYVAGWLEALDHDHKAIFTAASQAQKAVEYLAQLATSNHWRTI